MVEAERDASELQSYYNAATRTQIREFLESKRKRRNLNIDYDDLWSALESIAQGYARGMETGLTVGTMDEQRERLDRCTNTIDDLCRQLTNPLLYNWRFEGEGGIAARTGSPRTDLVKQLRELRSLLLEDAERLQTISAGKRAYGYGPQQHRECFQANILTVGLQLFGPKIGADVGPLLTFMQLALQPILGDDTPGPDTLRTFARRRVKSGKVSAS